MGVQQIEGSFRNYGSIGAGPADENCNDTLSLASAGAAWTAGDTLIDSLGAQSLNTIATPSWTILQASVSAILQGELVGGVGCKLGQIKAGLIRGASPTKGSNHFPDQGYILPLPADTSLIETLWDPSSDSFPPNPQVVPVTTNPALPPALNVSAEISLPQPIKIDPNVRIGIGIWMEPTLICGPAGAGYELIVKAAQWSLTYDDGLAGAG